MNDPEDNIYKCQMCGKDFTVRRHSLHKSTRFCADCLEEIECQKGEDRFQRMRDGE